MSWLALYMKELRLTRTSFLINMMSLVVVGGLLFYLIERHSPFFVTLTVLLIVAHFFYMFFAMLSSLRQEWKQKTTVFWLNIPVRGWQLLSAKFAAAMTQLFISLVTTFLITYFLLKNSSEYFPDPMVSNFLIRQMEAYWWVLFLGIFIASLQSGVVATFIYMMAKSVRKFGWLLGIAISMVGSWLWVRFQDTAIYRGVTEWGVIMRETEFMESLEIFLTLEKTQRFIWE
ncbi:hypothetical protein H1D32_09345 [Anaerobacillus sp. CMMVII]|uniref:hypothetical protein n=1 Tax=Anaerobacillus sp. CMMVII TaxID=2755588 RepID=UPI0021B7714A|nr:hypothetical protein [Anaerobacillus sp. CMMVII]MCT8137940.1 hypothetical protein [Anaerobacillus sp. CMMVII]